MPQIRRHIDLILFCAAALVFYALPQIDLWITGLAYDPATGFFLDQQWWVRIAYRSVGMLTPWLLGGLIGLTLAGWLFRRRAIGRYRMPASYLLLVLLLGPGLVVNTVFKDHWGRARPSQVVEFGGTERFTPAFVISDACDRNCSFVSGHASAGFFLVAGYFLRRQRRWLLAALLVGGYIGAARIVQGGHFASDVAFAFVAVYLVAQGLHRLMFGPEPAPATST